MEAVYFGFGLLVVSLVLGIILKHSGPKDALVTELSEVTISNSEQLTASQLDYQQINALRELVAHREQHVHWAGADLLGSDSPVDPHENIRKMVARLQSLSGTPSTQNTQP